MAVQPSYITQMRTYAWLHEAQRQTGAKGLSALANRYAKLTAGKADATLASREFKQYAFGKRTPSDDTIGEVEQFLPGTKAVFEIGPREDGKAVPLWAALHGDTATVISIIEHFDAERIRPLMAESAPLHDIAVIAVDHLGVPEDEIHLAMLNGFPTDETNVIAAAYQKNTASVSLNLLTTLIALWRYGSTINSDIPFLGYVMFGLTHRAIYDLLDPWGLGKPVVAFLNDLINQAFYKLMEIHKRTQQSTQAADDRMEPAA